jgi:predicted DNA binding protein
MRLKGRAARGSTHHWAKLTDSQVKGIRAALRNGERGVDIAARFGIAQSTVTYIKQGRIRRPINETEKDQA